MSDYKLYGCSLITNDETLRDFCICVLKRIEIEIDENDKLDDIRDTIMDHVSNFLTDDLSRTDIDYKALVIKYRGEIGDIMYQTEEQLGDPLMVTESFSFSKYAAYSFENLVYFYIMVHFKELLMEILAGSEAADWLETADLLKTVMET